MTEECTHIYDESGLVIGAVLGPAPTPERPAHLPPRAVDERVYVTFDLVQHLYRQHAFSMRAFGPGERAGMVLDHIRKELVEIEEHPEALEEWVDLLLLAFDGPLRQGFSPSAIANALHRKLEINQLRNWPDWRTADPNKAIKHVRGGHGE